MSVHQSHPQQQKLFEVIEGSEQLSDKKGYLFHSVVSILLFIMKMSKLYVETAVGLLKTRVSKSDLDNRENCEGL